MPVRRASLLFLRTFVWRELYKGEGAGKCGRFTLHSKDRIKLKCSPALDLPFDARCTRSCTRLRIWPNVLVHYRNGVNAELRNKGTEYRHRNHLFICFRVRSVGSRQCLRHWQAYLDHSSQEVRSPPFNEQPEKIRSKQD